MRDQGYETLTSTPTAAGLSPHVLSEVLGEWGVLPVIPSDPIEGHGGGTPKPPLDPSSALAPAAGEPLGFTSHPQIVNLSAYWRAGWVGAVQGAYLRGGALPRLYAVAEALPERFGLAIFDAWRTSVLQELLAYRPESPEHEPSSGDPRDPAAHNTGGAVDLTLTYEGHPLSLGTPFGDSTERAVTAYFEKTIAAKGAGIGPEEVAVVTVLRRLLFGVMSKEGFVNLPSRWWHFEYGTRRWAAQTGETPLYGPMTLF